MPDLTALGRALAAAGLTPARGLPDASEGRAEEAAVRPARLVEHPALETRAVGPAEPWPGVVAFLDGVQRHAVAAYAGSAPLILAEVAAGVRERRERVLRTAQVRRRRLALGRPAVLEIAAAALPDHDPVPIPAEEPLHPVRDLVAARRAVDQARGALEVELGERYLRDAPGWLVVDGSLSESPALASSPRALGVAKSHATLPFEGGDLDRYLRLPAGHRTSVFAPASRSVAPVYGWALRLWPWEGRDLLHGLVRVEAAPTEETLGLADRLSRWILRERAPLSTPDPRWDRLLYGIHDVEVFLRVGRQPVMISP